MTTTEIEPSQGKDLALDQQQSTWTERQRTALAHIGVDDATEGDLEVFFHVVKRTGLDPFARQIYMIGRQQNERRNGEWIKVTKQTIQTGIDGFRLIGRRAADQAGHTVSVDAPEWADDNGQWRPIWTKKWGTPLAARVTITRNGERFTAVTMFDEYAQTKRDGDLTQMWTQRPAGQIAKCAEAAAWRMAFPQDLSGLYATDEMGVGADLDDRGAASTRQPRSSALAEALAEGGETVDGEIVVEPEEASAPQGPIPLNTSSRLAKAMYAAINDAGISEKERIPWLASVVGRDITSSKEMTEDEARKVLDHLTDAIERPFSQDGAGQ